MRQVYNSCREYCIPVRTAHIWYLFTFQTLSNSVMFYCYCTHWFLYKWTKNGNVTEKCVITNKIYAIKYNGTIGNNNKSDYHILRKVTLRNQFVEILSQFLLKTFSKPKFIFFSIFWLKWFVWLNWIFVRFNRL